MIGIDSISAETSQQLPTKELFKHPTPGMTSVDLITELQKRGEIKPGDTVISILGRVARTHALAAIPALTQAVLAPTRPFDKMPNHPDVDELPATTVKRDGKTIKIHGIVHLPDKESDEKGTLYGLKNYVRKTMEDGDIWFVEQYLKKLYGLNGVLEMSDHAVIEAYQKTHPYKQDAVTTRLLALLISHEDPNHPKIDLEAFTQFTKAKGFPLLYEIIKELRALLTNSRTDLLTIRDIEKQIKLPEPLNMEYAMSHVSNPHFRSFVTDVSMEQARQIRASISSMSSNRTTHVLTGLAHESETIYFLQHPEYDPRTSLQKAREVLQHK